jgi:hypothetical protein
LICSADEDGNTVYSVVAAEKASEGKKKEGVKGRGKKKVPGPPSEVVFCHFYDVIMMSFP